MFSPGVYMDEDQDKSWGMAESDSWVILAISLLELTSSLFQTTVFQKDEE